MTMNRIRSGKVRTWFRIFDSMVIFSMILQLVAPVIVFTPRALAQETPVIATDPSSVTVPAIDTPKVDPTPAPVELKVETPAPVPTSAVDPASKVADPVTDPTSTPVPAVDLTSKATDLETTPVTDPTPTPVPAVDPTPATVQVSDMPTTPTVDAAGEATIERAIPEWVADSNKQTTSNVVVLGKKYVAPQNDQVTVTFTKLPTTPGKLSIEEITLTDEQVASLHALSNKAYDITSDMADGTFTYTMTLPKPKNQQKVQIKFAEDVAGLESADTVPSADVTTKTDSVSAGLDHFTIFVVSSPLLTGNDCANAGADIGTVCYATLEEAIVSASANSGADTIKLVGTTLTLSVRETTLPVGDTIQIPSGYNLIVPNGVSLIIQKTGGVLNEGTLTIENGGVATSTNPSSITNSGTGKTVINAGGSVTDNSIPYVGLSGMINPTDGSLEIISSGMHIPSGSKASLLSNFGVTDTLVVDGELTNNSGFGFSVAGTVTISSSGTLINHGTITLGSDVSGAAKTLTIAGIYRGETLPTGNGTLTITGTVEVSTASELTNAINYVQVSKIKLINDFTVDSVLQIFSGTARTLEIDGNNKTISASGTFNAGSAGSVIQTSDTSDNGTTLTIKNLTVDANKKAKNAFQAYKAGPQIVLQNLTVKNALHTGLMVNRSPKVTLDGLTVGTGAASNGSYDIFVKSPDTLNASLIATNIPESVKIFKANPGTGMTVSLSVNGTQAPDTLGIDTATANGLQEGGTLGWNVVVPTLSSIAITHPANKLTYTVGESLDITGLTVTGTYDYRNPSTKTETVILSDISGFNSSSPEVGQTLTITVGGKTTAYTVIINKASQSSLTVTNTSGIYPTGWTVGTSGGDGTGTVTFGVVSGTASGCSVVAGTGALTFTSAGTCLVTATKASDTNYNVVSSASTEITIDKATQAALVTTAHAVTAPASFSALATTGGSGGGVVTFALTDAGTAGCSISGTSLSYATAGTCTVTATKATDANYLVASSAAQTFTVNIGTQSTLTITSTTATYGADLSLTISGGTTGGAVTHIRDSGACTVSGSTLTPTAAGSCFVTASMSGNGSYNVVSSASTEITIGTRAVTVTADAQTKTYGATDPTLTYQITNGSLKTGDSFTGSLSRTAGEDVGTYAITQGTFALSGNYELTYVGANLVIGKKALTVTATADDKVYDGNAIATVTLGVTGKVGSDVVSTTGGSASFADPNVADGITVTASGYTLAGAASGNYSFNATATTTANITKATSSTTVTCPASATYTGSAVTPCTVLVTGAGGLSLTPDPTYASNTNVGIASVSYTYAGDDNHTGSSASSTFSIGQTTPDELGGLATVDNSHPQVVITNLFQSVTLNVKNGTTDPSIDVSGLLRGGVSGILPEITINTEVAKVVIPGGTKVTGPTGWNGVISAPTSGTPSGGIAPAGFAVGGTVITLGSPSGTIMFSSPVLITLLGVTGTVGYRPSGSNIWTEITNICTGTYENPTGAPAGGECTIDNGTDTKILTYHFTLFGELFDTQAPDPVSDLDATYGPTTNGKVEVGWHAKDSTIDKVIVYRGTTRRFTMNRGSRVARQNRTDDTYFDKNVTEGKTYYYKVVTEDAFGNQSDAEVIKIVVSNDGTVATGAVVGTESVPKDNSIAVAQAGADAGVVSEAVSGATTDTKPATTTNKAVVTENNDKSAVLGTETQSDGFWGSGWMWIIMIVIGGGGIAFFMRRRDDGLV